MRGIAYIQMPTTLLAMVDSSVGGKCAIDLSCGKNLAGAFWQPAAVIADVGCLGTLTPERLADGCGEVVKHGAIADRELFELLEKTPFTFDLLTHDLSLAAAIIARNVEIKRDVVVADEREGGIRKILNFGHSIGHAIEARSGYTRGHGSCVAAGMVAMARGSRRAGWNAYDLEDDLADRIEALCRAHGLDTTCSYGTDELMEAALHDKKRALTASNTIITPPIDDNDNENNNTSSSSSSSPSLRYPIPSWIVDEVNAKNQTFTTFAGERFSAADLQSNAFLRSLDAQARFPRRPRDIERAIDTFGLYPFLSPRQARSPAKRTVDRGYSLLNRHQKRTDAGVTIAFASGKSVLPPNLPVDGRARARAWRSARAAATSSLTGNRCLMWVAGRTVE